LHWYDIVLHALTLIASGQKNKSRCLSEGRGHFATLGLTPVLSSTSIL
jgi:hypothetical protein